MSEHILFLTGRLAEKNLHRVLEAMQPAPFRHSVLALSLQVAGLMTSDMIQRRLPDANGIDRVMVPGRCRGNLDALSSHFGVPFVRGPEDLKDLPRYFGREAAPIDLTRHDVRIFAEIVDAPNMSLMAMLDQANDYRNAGADVIDLGCLPETPFRHLEEAVAMLHAAGFAVSVDSMDPQELLRGGRAGADFLLSLKEETLWIADEVASTPVLIPSTPSDMESLYRTIEVMKKKGRDYLADAVIEPIHFGFTESLVRYRDLRKKCPDAKMMMGTGNLTELTEADTLGIQALLMGIVSELRITNILTTQVSAHASGVIREADQARRVMYAAREAGDLPQGFGETLLALHTLDPFPWSAEEIAATAAEIKDPSFRVQISPDGLHIYNRDGLRTATDPFKLFPHLGLEHDGSHAFYLGVELARAQIAWQLSKRYVQDSELDWGVAQIRASTDADAQFVASPQIVKSKAGS
ncbi:MAG: dihydropteroate synthase [Betaproteobacteria bacterium]|nr:dihydropteroate synthase [Betaproteobacteria bacterium]